MYVHLYIWKDVCTSLHMEVIHHMIVMTLHRLHRCQFQKEIENSLISAILSGHYFVVRYGFLSPSWSLEVICYLGHVKKCNVM